MTLANIIRRALIELGRSTDAQATEAWREKLTMFANDAVQDLCEYLELRRVDTVEAKDGKFLLSDLTHGCLKVIDVQQNGGAVSFTQSDASASVDVSSDGEISVEYRYAPMEMKNDVDTPEVPEYLHRLIVSYVVFREHLTADPTMQRRSDAFYQLYETGKRAARKDLGETNTFKIYNTGW